MVDRDDILKMRRGLERGLEVRIFVTMRNGFVEWFAVKDIVELKKETQILGRSPKDGRYLTASVKKGEWNPVSLDPLAFDREKAAKAHKAAKARWAKEKEKENEN